MLKTKLGLTNNQLKIIAMITMLVDHAGVVLFPNVMWLRYIGRLSFPIFAYMIAEGCRYTRNRLKYFLQIFVLAAVCQIVFFVAQGSLLQGVLVTFSLSVGLIFAIDYFVDRKNIVSGLVLAAVSGLVLFLTLALPKLLPGTDFNVDYKICGVLLPVVVRFMPNKPMKLLGTAVMLLGLVPIYGTVQLPALFALPLLAVYNGTRGKWNLKYLFYIFYPVHLVVIYLISILIA